MERTPLTSGVCGKARAQDRHRNPGRVEIEENPGARREGACEELAHVLQSILLNMFDSRLEPRAERMVEDQAPPL